MKLILQPKGSSLCGQCCIAMLLNISLEEAIKLVGHSGISSDQDLMNVLEPKFERVTFRSFFGKIKYRNRDITKKRVYLCKHRNPFNSNMEHWTVCYQGNILDPSGRPEKDLWPMYRYWIVK